MNAKREMAESSKLSSYKREKRRTFMIRFKKEVVGFAIDNSNTSATQKYKVAPKRVQEPCLGLK